MAAQFELDISGFEQVDAPHSHASADMAVELAREGKAEMLMKGSLHTDELMGAVVRSATGLRTERRISHAFVMDVPSLDRPIIITDAAINIFPTLEDKQHIIQNAIDLAIALGSGGAEGRDPVRGGDGEPARSRPPSRPPPCARWPIASRSSAVSWTARWPWTTPSTSRPPTSRRSTRRWPGCADILVVPDLEAGNMLAKSLTFLADADGAGIVLGARVPIILTSRADSVTTRLASCAVAALVAEYRRKDASKAVAA